MMELLENKLNNLVKADLKYFTILKDGLVEDDRDGHLFVISKKYLKKLSKMNKNYLDLFVDKTNDICIIAKESSVEWCKQFNQWLNKHSFEEITFKVFDNCYCQDEYVIKSDNGTYFSLYFDLLNEHIEMYSLNDIGTNLKVFYEGTYFFDENGFEDIKLALFSKIDLSTLYDEKIEMSVSEYLEVLKFLGLVKKNKKFGWILTKQGDEEEQNHRIPNISGAVDIINETSQLGAHFISSGITFDTVRKILSSKFNDIKVSNFYYLYNKNLTETLDKNLVEQCGGYNTF